jgi:hypothetical protein
MTLGRATGGGSSLERFGIPLAEILLHGRKLGGRLALRRVLDLKVVCRLGRVIEQRVRRVVWAVVRGGERGKCLVEAGGGSA